MMKRAWKRTKFPRLRMRKNHAPDLEEVSCDSSVSSIDSQDKECVEEEKQLVEAKYNSKEDEDVAVFMNLAKNLPVSSLLFLLQNSVKAQNFPLAYDLPQSQPKPTRLSKVKKFRFAEISGGAVRQVVHIIPRNDEDCEAPLWWTEQETKQMRSGALYLVMAYRKSQELLDSFSESIEYLADSYQHDKSSDDKHDLLLENHVKYLTSNKQALPLVRGLEIHIAPFFEESKQAYTEAVIDEQDLCNGISYDESSARIRKAARSASIQSRSLARKIGLCDQIIALTACMASWDKESG